MVSIGWVRVVCVCAGDQVRGPPCGWNDFLVEDGRRRGTCDPGYCYCYCYSASYCYYS